jgi:hypothetical protein
MEAAVAELTGPPRGERIPTPASRTRRVPVRPWDTRVDPIDLAVPDIRDLRATVDEVARDQALGVERRAAQARRYGCGPV